MLGRIIGTIIFMLGIVLMFGVALRMETSATFRLFFFIGIVLLILAPIVKFLINKYVTKKDKK